MVKQPWRVGLLFSQTGVTAGIEQNALQASLLAMKVVFSAVGNQWDYRGFKDARVPQTWSPRLTLVEETSLSHAPEVDLYPLAARVSTRPLYDPAMSFGAASAISMSAVFILMMPRNAPLRPL